MQLNEEGVGGGGGVWLGFKSQRRLIYGELKTGCTFFCLQVDGPITGRGEAL